MKSYFIILSIAIMLSGCFGSDYVPDKPDKEFWEVVSPSSQQMNENVVLGIESVVSNLNNVYSFILIRNGKIVSEQYQNEKTADSLLNICSITKRITSSLIGIAIDKSIINGDQTLIHNYFPEISNFQADPKWNDINIYHLENMISGMDWVEVMHLPAFQSNFMNPLPFIFSRSISKTTGQNFSYNTVSTHLLSYIVQRASNQNTDDFAVEKLFNLIGIKKFNWMKDGNGVVNGGAGLELKARDLARFGLLYMQNGQWCNKQVISESWINKSLYTPVILDTLESVILATSPDEVTNTGMSIGNTWWTREFMGKTVHYGDGYGGQILMLIPEINIIIVMNRNENVELYDNIAAFNEFFNQILPMVINSVIPDGN